MLRLDNVIQIQCYRKMLELNLLEQNLDLPLADYVVLIGISFSKEKMEKLKIFKIDYDPKKWLNTEGRERFTIHFEPFRIQS